MTVGQATRHRILDLCTERDVTLNKLSIMCGVTQSTLHNIVNGKSYAPRISTVKKICDGLDITIREFFQSPRFENLEQEIQ